MSDKEPPEQPAQPLPEGDGGDQRGDRVRESGEEQKAEPEADRSDPLPSPGKDIERFVRSLEAIRTTLSVGSLSVIAASLMADEALSRFTKSHGLTREESDGSASFKVPVESQHEFLKHVKRLRRVQLARRAFPRITLVALVSQYDAFVGRLVRTLYLLRPELLSASERQLTAAQILRFGSFQEVKDYIVEKESESLLRESHVEQFQRLENRFAVPLTKDLPGWKRFVEMTERRNLFVHTDGVVSRQYLQVCEEQKAFPEERPALGQTLDVSPEYFESSYECLLEIGVKLGQVLWRKQRPDQLDEADASLTSTTYELIADGQYRLAENLLLFGTDTLKKHGSDANKRIMLVNLAQSKKWQGDDAGCKKTLALVDWSACSIEFELAVAVLEDRFGDAAQIMRQVGISKKVSKQDYLHWPLFQVFRPTEEFKRAFVDIFGEEPATIEDVPLSERRKRPSHFSVMDKDLFDLMRSFEREAELEAGGKTDEGNGESSSEKPEASLAAEAFSPKPN